MKVAVLLSGGVDSSVALRLLRESGEHELTAFYLKIWLEDELAFLGECPWEEDLRYARQVCEEAGVPLEVIPMQRDYHERVVSWALDELRAGRTPSPDILCNRRIKFGLFLDRLDEGAGGFDRVASGHYARVGGEPGSPLLLRAADPVKDQTYFLCRLRREQLARCVFPVGGHQKEEVRRLAAGFGLPNRDRKDSQGICFLGKISYDGFVRSYLGERKGTILEAGSGRTLGEHRGHWFHTIGQRKGLGLPAGPWYVVRKDAAANEIWVTHGDRLEAAARNRFRLVGSSWLREPEAGAATEVKVRHTPRSAPCSIRPLGDGTWDVEMAEDDPGLAPGQSAVFYEGEVCLGGGTIEIGD